MSKYFSDIQSFPNQLSHHYDVDLSHLPQISRIIVCGMGGSALYVPLVTNLLHAYQIDCRLEVASTYTIPTCDVAHTLIICASHSGNTEETLSCLDQARRQGNHIVIFTSGAKLLESARLYDIPYYLIPTGLQSRLSTGYFLVAMLDILIQTGYPVQDILTRLQSAASSLHTVVSIDQAKEMAKVLV
jgi:glucose/mannose-6-phosphate isomerase